jgi:excisionase family DNA binding protein
VSEQTPVEGGSAMILYRIFGDRSTLLYVGITDNYDRRMRQHSEKSWWRDVRRIDTQEFATRTEALRAETVAIKAERPLHNRAQNAPSPRTPLPARDRVGEARYISLAEAAEYVGVHPRTIRRRISEGSIRAVRFGRLIKVDLADLESALRVIPTAGGAR